MTSSWAQRKIVIVSATAGISSTRDPFCFAPVSTGKLALLGGSRDDLRASHRAFVTDARLLDQRSTRGCTSKTHARATSMNAGAITMDASGPSRLDSDE